MKLMSRAFLLLILFVMLLPLTARAQDADDYGLALGVGANLSTSEYKGDGSSVSPFPIVNYDGDVFFIHGLSAGAHLYSEGAHDFSILASYLSQSFDASDNDDDDMKELDDRYASMMAGFEYSFSSEYGVAKVSVLADVLDTNNGFMADMSYAYPFKASFLKIVPKVGVEWTSDEYNDYYYGISSGESAASGLAEYKAEADFSPYAGVSMKTSLTESVDMMLRTKVKFLGSEITDSPMVDEDVTYSIGLGITYSF